MAKFQGVVANLIILLLTFNSSGVVECQPQQRVIPATEFTPTQFHIQTDEGSKRFFNYQTWSGQFRKETRLDDGTVVGSYGWVDANNILRIYDYIADSSGYRIAKTRLFKVDGRKSQNENEIGNEINDVVVAPTVIPTRAGPLRVPFKTVKPLGNNHNNPIVTEPTPTESTEFKRPERNVLRDDFQPIFDYDSPASTKAIRGPPSVVALTGRGEGNFLTFGDRRRSKSFDNRRVRIVKRRRRPNAVIDNGEKTSVNYGTDKAYHREVVRPDGSRKGEYGYIDPFGIRRVVTYGTGNEGIEKIKENDYVGLNTYFQAS